MTPAERPQNQLTHERAAALGRAGGRAAAPKRRNSAKWRAINRVMCESGGTPGWEHLADLWRTAYHAAIAAQSKRRSRGQDAPLEAS